MKVVGLCGGSGSGKGLVCSFFNDLGVKCIDTDKVYHDIISVNSDCTNELIAYFGDEISAQTGINRAKLREVAFSSRQNLARLNEITHKHILKEVRKQIDEIRSNGHAIGVIVDAPLLFESSFDKECDCSIAVIADIDIRIQRIMARDGISREHALTRILSQRSDDDLIKKCDYVIENNSIPDKLRETVYELTKIIFAK